MSLSRNPSFFREYARSGYQAKMNPEFDGIARRYYREKKEHEKVHTLKKRLDQEVAFMERRQRKIQQNLSKKQHQLKYTKEVTSRFQTDLKRVTSLHMQREWITDFNTQQLRNNQQKASLIKSQSTIRLQEAKDYLRDQRRSLANLHREENQRVKDERTLKKAKEQDTNRNKVHQIYQAKKEAKEHCNQFYQSRTGSSLKNYQSRINVFRQYKQSDAEKIRSLEKRLAQLKQSANHKQEKATQLEIQIGKLKQEAKLENTLIRSQLRSKSSLSVRSTRSLNPTPIPILTPTMSMQGE